MSVIERVRARISAMEDGPSLRALVPPVHSADLRAFLAVVEAAREMYDLSPDRLDERATPAEQRVWLAAGVRLSAALAAVEDAP